MAFGVKGLLLQHDVGSGFETILDISEIDGPEGQVEFQEILPITSSAVEKFPTVVNWGAITGKGYWNPEDGTHADVVAKIASPEVIDFKLIYANTGASVMTFEGFWSKFKRTGVDARGVAEFEYEIQASGQVTITP